MFLGALCRLKPDLSAELWSTEVGKLMDAAWAATVQLADDALEYLNGLPGAVDRAESQFSSTAWNCAQDEVRRYILDWQTRHDLTDSWLFHVAHATIELAYDVRLNGMRDDVQEPLPLALPHYELVPGMLHAGLEKPPPGDLMPTLSTTRVTAEHQQVRRTLRIDDLKVPPVESEHGYWDDEGDFSTYDPRGERPEDAISRVMDALRVRVELMLQRIWDDDKALNNAVEVVTIGHKPFDYLARNLVDGEHAALIAERTGADAGNVRRDLARAADLAGIPRTRIVRDPGGRPRSAKVDRQRGPVRLT
jgi:hypothetical protein